MKRKPYFILKIIMFMFLFMIPVCFSDWVYLNKTASVAAANTDEVTVTIHTRQYVDDVVTDNYANKKEVSSRTKNGSSVINPYEVNDVITPEYVVDTQTGPVVDGIQIVTVTKREYLIGKRCICVSNINIRFLCMSGLLKQKRLIQLIMRPIQSKWQKETPSVLLI